MSTRPNHLSKEIRDFVLQNSNQIQVHVYTLIHRQNCGNQRTENFLIESQVSLKQMNLEWPYTLSPP